MSADKLAVDPQELQAAAHRLDQLAARLHGALETAEHQTKVASAGQDEVSVRAAQTFNTVATSVDTDTGAAVLELRKIAAVLRSQAKTYGNTEDANTQAFLA
ncbi:hypothetical protein GOARA_091_00280 [Gordonia araii NBRC 100433]|uniref:PE domain-containing protein n=1 Tax=Gordonia araii NBRC 100433 TaxID=1073574 RepID=G7H7T5_9ACTN|nr:PE family protein [Gordonia araii]NNG95649.1 PE family protein [Gordonia araii NBRC 100433]GAB11910.1 hypothetical protein GOARA_091_00280 [Gordonia araii NBRC 100433]